MARLLQTITSALKRLQRPFKTVPKHDENTAKRSLDFSSDYDSRRQKRLKQEEAVDAEMTKFLQELIDTEVDSDNFLRLPTTFFPAVGRRCKRKAMFLHKSYSRLYDCIFSADHPSIHLKGRTGTGKSFWMYYAIWRTFRENSNAVVFLESKHKPGICFRLHQRKVQRVDLDDYEEELWLDSTWYFAEGMAPTRVLGHCKIIMLTTLGVAIPDHGAKGFIEKEALTYVMPPSDHDEITAVYQEIYKSSITEERFKQLLDLYGPNYWDVLDMPSIQDEKHDYDAARKAAALCSVHEIAGMFLIPSLCRWPVGVLLQPIPTQDFAFGGFCFASGQMLRMFATAAFKRRQSIGQLMGYLPGDASTAAVEDCGYEFAAHEAITSGGTFSVVTADGQKPVEASGPGWILNADGQMVFHVTDRGTFEPGQLRCQIQEHGGTSALYLVQASTKLFVISSVLSPNMVLQMTRESSCTVPWQQLTRILDCLPESSVYRFMYVVPNKESFQVHGMDQQPKDGRVSKVKVYTLEYDKAHKRNVPSEPAS